MEPPNLFIYFILFVSVGKKNVGFAEQTMLMMYLLKHMGNAVISVAQQNLCRVC